MRRVARVEAAMLETRAAMLAQRSFKGDAKSSAIDFAIAALDLTTLEGKDTPGTVRALCARGMRPAADAPAVAAICVYPVLVSTAVCALAGSAVRVAAVATGFPTGHATLEAKVRETRDAVAAGTDEIDMVIDRGAFLAGQYDAVCAEIAAVREAAGSAVLNVILEAGELGSYAAIRRACDLALEAGADFLGTATGKIGSATTAPIALLLCEAIRDHVRAGGGPVGLKVAGGIAHTKVALGYLAIVNETLGPAWLSPGRFRFGASALLGDLLLQREKNRSGAYAGTAYVALA